MSAAAVKGVQPEPQKHQCRCGAFETYAGAWRPCAKCAQTDAEWSAWAEGKSDKEIRSRQWREFLDSMPETRIFGGFGKPSK